MRSLQGVRRRWLVRIALAVLTCVNGSLVAAPAALCCPPALMRIGATGQAPAVDDACCAGLGPGETCPMHGHRQPDGAAVPEATSADRLTCVCEPEHVALRALLGVTGLLPIPAFQAVSGALSERQDSTIAPVSTVAHSPDPPPPRA